MPGELSPKAQEALNDIQLMQGEEVVYAVQADGFFLGSNPILKMIGAWQAFVTKITGGHIRVYLILTNLRLLMIESQSAMCGCNKLRSTKVLSTADIVEAGSGKATALCFIHTRYLQIETLSQVHILAVKKLRDEDLRAFVTNMSQLIIANSQR